MSDVLTGRRGRLALSAVSILAAIFIAAPILVLVPLAFSGSNNLLLPPDSFSIRWFLNLVEQPRWRNSAWLSIVTALLSAGIATVLGTLAAIGISRLPPAYARIVRLLFIAPMIVPLMVIAVGFYIFFTHLKLVGHFWSLPFSHAVLGLPFVVLPVLARLTSMNQGLEMAAGSLGATQGRILLRIVVPQLYPAMIAGFALAFITSFDEVIVAQFLTGPRLETLPRRMWEGLSVGGLDNTITAIAVAQLALALLILVAFELRIRRRPTKIDRSMSQQQTPIPAPSIASQPAVPDNQETPVGVGVPIRLENLSKHYGAVAAVSDIDIGVEAGELLSILGPSGSGKTTLLMLIAGFAAVDSGRLLLGGADVSKLPPHKRDIGVVFQDYALFPHLDVMENVAFPLAARGGLSKADIRRRSQEALALVRLEGFGNRRVDQLSGGQQQRVALARAIVFNPRALLMDEPLAALDKSLRLDMQAEIRALQRSVGHTTIYVTHDQEEALNLSDRIAVMNHGRLQQIGTPKELYQSPASPFVASFFGEANLLTGSVEAGSFVANGFETRLPAAGQAEGAATACLRPDRIRLAQDGGLIEGTLVDVRFSGPVTRFSVQTAAGILKVTRPTAEVTPSSVAGSPVSLAFDPDALHLMRTTP
ncbi:MAG: ATP-binding cassette domain-containing protein [Mesorhizobium sp.]